MFSKKAVSQKRNFSYPFQSISYNNVVARKQFCFSHKFLKSWVYISDIIVVREEGDSQYNHMWNRHRDFILSNNYLDDVFILKDLLDFNLKSTLV